MIKYFVIVPLIALSACGKLGERVCEFTVDNSMQFLRNDIIQAETNLKRGFVWVDETEVRKSVNTSAINTDFDLRTASCLRLDLDGNEQRYTCFYQITYQSGQRIHIDPEFEKQVIAIATQQMADKRINRARDINECRGL